MPSCDGKHRLLALWTRIPKARALQIVPMTGVGRALSTM